MKIPALKLLAGLTLLLVLLSQSAIAEDTEADEIPVLKPRSLNDRSIKPKKRLRQLASLEPGENENPQPVTESSRVENPRGTRSHKETLFRFGIAGGISLLNTPAAATATGAIGQNIYVGANADFRHSFYGAEFEGFYGLGATPLTKATSTNPGNESFAQYGGIVNAKVQTSFSSGAVKFTPKVGLGYGVSGISGTDTAETVFSSYQLTGPVWVVGIDVEPSANLLFQADYAHSVFTDGSYSDGTTIYPGVNAGFDRLRIGGYVKIAPSLLLGGQFVQRSLSVTFPTSVNAKTQDKSQSQFLGVLMYEL